MFGRSNFGGIDDDLAWAITNSGTVSSVTDAIKKYGQQAVTALKQQGAEDLVKKYGKDAVPIISAYGVAKAKAMLDAKAAVTSPATAAAAIGVAKSNTTLYVVGGLILAAILLRKYA